jgi:hypothetical protein
MMAGVRGEQRLTVIDLEPFGTTGDGRALSAMITEASATQAVVVGRARADQAGALLPVMERLTLTVIDDADGTSPPPPCIAVPDIDRALADLEATVAAAPMAALVLSQLLAPSSQASVERGLLAESAAYSMLLASPEFAAWRSRRPVRADPGPREAAVLMARDADTLTITLNRPERHNAFSRWVRDGVCDALDLALADPRIVTVRLVGAGPSFCSGGDLDEFGSQPDVALAHAIRIDRSVGRRLHRLGSRTVVDLHGACIGAGIELAAFAGRVRARTGSWFALPELSMGLIPGAGGTVSLPRRIGRWRTGWLALTGQRLDLDTALGWGLVDERIDG